MNCLRTTGFPLDFLHVLFISRHFPGCPRHVPVHSFQFPLHVPVIFSVCPLHFPCMSLSFIASHFPTSPFVSFGFLVLCLPFSSPLTPLAFISFPLRSLSVALCCLFISSCFPVMSTSCPVHVLACSFISSPHVPALPCIFPSLPGIFPRKDMVFSMFSQKGHETQHSFSRVSAKGSREPAGGFNSGTPVLRHRLPEDQF